MIAANTLMESAPLFQSSQGTITENDFVRTLERIGVQKGDTLFVHSDCGVFGRFSDGVTKQQILDGLVSSMRSAIGPAGNLILPTFSYSFCKAESFDPQSSRSRVGALTEHFRRIPGVVRTRHPIFSVAIQGPDCANLADVDRDSFGPNSIFGKLFDRNAMIVFLGAPFGSMTFVHYPEQIRGVDYRYLKTFHGNIVQDKLESPTDCTFYVRVLDREVITDLSFLETTLIESGMLRYEKIGEGRIGAVRARDVFQTVNQLIDSNPYALLKSAPK